MTYEELIASKNQRLKDFYESGTKLVTVKNILFFTARSIIKTLVNSKKG